MNNYILLVLIIIIVIYILYLYKNKTIKTSEKYNNFDIEYNEDRDINLSNENSTVYDYNHLINFLKKINSVNMVNLKGETEYRTYTQSTTERVTRDDLRNISNIIVPLLNKQGHYRFKSTNFGDVEIWTDKNNNEQIKYELFLWDCLHYFEIKLIVNVIKFVNKNDRAKYGVEKSPFIFPYYNIGIPSHDQLIPSPMDVIPTANMVLSPQSISPNDPLPPSHIYINRIYIQNSTLIINYNQNNKRNNKEKISSNNGISDQTLEYTDLQGDHTPYFEKGKQYNMWPVLDEMPKWKAQYPAKDPSIDWDENGVYKPIPTEILNSERKSFCSLPGTRWSPNKEPLQPNYWPTLAAVPQKCGPYAWLFDLSAQLPTTFSGGGKM